MSGTAPSLDEVVAAGVAERRKLDAQVVTRVLQLLGEGKPVPYLARYRREQVGGLDEGELRGIGREADTVREMEQRREFILRAMDAREVPDKVRRRVERCRSRLELEYLYEPYRPPRKTPGTVARERGLCPLAEAYLANETPDVASFVDADKEVPDEETALYGAREILAERFAVDPAVRITMLRVVEKEGVIGADPAHGKDEIPKRFSHLKTYEERLARTPSHRFLALHRAEKEGAVSIRLAFPDEKVLAIISQRFYPAEPVEAAKEFLDHAAHDAIRLMRPAIFQDALHHAKERADAEAIGVFRNNLHDLLLYPPAGPHRVLGVDPAPRGAIPLACVDERGQPLGHARLKFFDRDETKRAAALARVADLVGTHGIQLVALGNGQGRRECETFLREALAGLEEAPPIVVVNEVGVGSYASGPVGRSELPALPVPVRGAVSLARRLMDPLPELVKVDPRQIGVGQYQHDIDPATLGRALDEVVEHCVNLVGVDVNRAPVQQLAHVCGFTTSIARSLVDHRGKHGLFRRLVELKELPFISEQRFEHAAGFLRIHDGESPLAATGVHPAHEALVERIAAAVGVTPVELIGNGERLAGIVAEDFADDEFGPATVAGVLYELLDGGKDPRPPLELARPSANVRSAADLKAGMRISGRVTNVTNFGAFVDVGVQQDGLVHVSELADYFVKDPTSIVRVGQVVDVKVLGVDSESGRISLTMKSGRERTQRRDRDRDRDRRRPRRGPPRQREGRREREPREERSEPAAAESAPEPVAPAISENPVPDDMTEEEFMKRKMEELRRRFS